jgi:PAS domain S-box-containing protein
MRWVVGPSPLAVVVFAWISWRRSELSGWLVPTFVGATTLAIAVLWRQLALAHRARLAVAGMTVAAIAALFGFGPTLGVGLMFMSSITLAVWLLDDAGLVVTYVVASVAFPIAALAVHLDWIATSTFPVAVWLRIGVVALFVLCGYSLAMRRIRRGQFDALTASYNAARALQASEARFGGVFEFAPDALLIVDAAGRIVLANRLAETMTGYSRDELIALTVEDLVPAARRARHVELREGYRTQATPRRMGAGSQLWALHKNGTDVPVEISLSPLHADGGLTVAAMRDVSERLRLENERASLETHLRQSHKMESLGTLAGGIAHDFNNLLTVIITNAELARAPDRIGDNLDAIATASTRAADLVRQILSFSRNQPSVRAPSSLRTVVEEATRLLRATLPTAIQLVIEIADDLPVVFIDSTQILQVLMNFGTNAWHAIDRPNGTIRIEVDAIGPEAITVRGMAPGRYARTRVRDDGRGIDPANLTRVFEPFFTTKTVGQGTGLGLAVAHGIITSHGGAIEVDSAPGRGSTFTMYLPESTVAAREVKPIAPTVPAADAAQRGSGRVVVIDDEEPVGKALAKVVERLGYTVSRFVRPADAVAAVRDDPHAFDLILTDLNMPEIGGLDVAHMIHGIRPELPVVLVSGNLVHTSEQLAAAGILCSLAKPFTNHDLSVILKRGMAATRR